MVEPAMTRFPVPDVADLPEDLRDRIDDERADAGFVPNVFRAYAYLPSHFRAFFAYYDALVRLYAADPHLAEQLATNHRTADVSDRRRAMLDFAVKLAADAPAVDAEDFERLREHGFSRRAIWDVGSVAAFFSLSNRMAHLADVRPNEEFYDLGR